jgi:hypothetical protein
VNKTTVRALRAAVSRIDQERERLSLYLSRLLGEATRDVARDHPGCEVTGLAAMGHWFIVATGNDGETKYGSSEGETPHPVLDLFDDIWQDYQVYPTIRFDVDAAGNMTSREDW